MTNLKTIEPLDLSPDVEIDDGGDALQKEIMEQFGDMLDDVDVFKALVLVATFQRDKLGKNSKLLAANTTKKEDIYQGRVGLVVRIGPLAFVDNKDVQFAGKRVDPGDFCFYTPADGKRLQINGVECRLMEDVHIDGKVTDPYVLL